MGGEASVVCITSVPTQTGDQREGMCLQQGVEREKERGKEKSHTFQITLACGCGLRAILVMP